MCANLTDATELEVCRWRAKVTSQATAGATLVNHDTALPAGITGNFTVSAVNPDGTGAEFFVPAGAAAASTLGSTTDPAKYLCWLPRTGSDLAGDPTNGIVIQVNAILRADVGVPTMWQFMKAILGTLAVGLKLKSRPTFGSHGHLAKSVYANDTARNAAIPSPQNGDGPVHNTAEGADQNYIGGVWINEESGATENMSETVAGKAEAATLAEQGAHTEKGSTGALVVLQSKNTVKTPATYTPGYLTCGTGGESNFALWNDVTDASIRIPIDGTTHNVDGIDFTGAGDMDAVMVILQAAIRVATGGQEIVVWSTDHAIITSGSTESTSEVLVLTTSTGTVGTDISGAGAANWLDADSGQGTPTAAVLDQTQDENKAVVLDSNGTIDPTIVPKASDAEIATGVNDAKYPTIAGVVHLLGNLVNTVHTYFVNTRATKTTPADADSVMICDSADSSKDKKITVANFGKGVSGDFPRSFFKSTRITLFGEHQENAGGTGGVSIGGGGFVTVCSGGTTGGRGSAYFCSPNFINDISSENPRWFARCKFSATTNQDAVMGMSNAYTPPTNSTTTVDHAAFLVEDGTLYASVGDGTTQNKSATITCTLTNRNEFYIEKDGSDYKFYLNGVLEETLSSNIPNSSLYLFVIGITSADSEVKSIYFAQHSVSFDE